MSFGFISLSGAVIVVLMLIPNIIYAIRCRGETNACTNRFMMFRRDRTQREEKGSCCCS